MNQGEFYGSNEYNSISEYKHFPAETYRKPREENQCGKEDADLGKESTSLQPKPRHPKKSGDTGTLIDKIFSTIRGATAVATVAASVVVTSSLAAGAPEAELLSYACSDTYIEYEMEISGLDEDGEYAIVLSTTDEEDIETEVNGDGTYSNRIDGLKPEWEYTLALIEYDSVLGEIRHLEIKLQTLKYSDQDPIPPPITEPEPNPVPNPEPEQEPKPIPSVTVTGVEISGLNEVKVSFTYSDISDGGKIELDVLFGDSTTDKITLTDEDVLRGYTYLSMETSPTLTVTPSVITDNDGEQEITKCEGYTYTFTETFSVETTVVLHSYYREITFYPLGIACGADQIIVTSSLNPEAKESLWLEDVVRMQYSDEDVITYTIYLSNDNGDVLSNEVTLTVDTSMTPPEHQYQINSVNPGNVGITYNDDGTINMYIDTDFSSNSEDVYYQISVGSIRYVSREPIARIENIPDKSYALIYDVCIDVDGMQYSIFRTVPSGMANEANMYFESDFTDNALSLKFDKEYIHLDLSEVRLVSSSGEEIILTEADFAYNEDGGTYDAVAQFSEYADEVVIYLMANPYYNGLEEIDGYIGNTRKIFEVTVYQP